MKKTNHRELCTTQFHIRKYGYTGVILICVFSKDTERHRKKKKQFLPFGGGTGDRERGVLLFIYTIHY